MTEKLIKRYPDVFLDELRNNLPEHEFEIVENKLIVRPWFKTDFSQGKISISRLSEFKVDQIQDAISNLKAHNRDLKIHSILLEFKLL